MAKLVRNAVFLVAFALAFGPQAAVGAVLVVGAGLLALRSRAVR